MTFYRPHAPFFLWLTFVAASCTQNSVPASTDSSDAGDTAAQPDRQSDATADSDQLCPAACDDGNPCTDDACFPTTGCKHTTNDGNACELDGSACSMDKCASGKCTPGPAKDCDDKLPCTQDMCDPKTAACAHAPMADKSICSDDFACTIDEACVAGVCLGGSGSDLKCDDSNQCTVDICGLTSGCKHPSQPDGTACGVPGGLCGVAEDGQCIAGTCSQSAGPPFEQTYGDAPSDGFRAVIPVNGGFGLAGGVGNKNIIVRTDASGKTLWQTELTAFPRDATAVAGDGFAVVGDYYQPNTTNNDWKLERVDASGKILWGQTYGGGNTDSPAALAALPDGFALVGWTGSKGGGVAAAWLVRTDAKGIMLWDNTFNAGDNTSFTSVVAFGDGFACFGENCANGQWQAYLVRTDASGTQSWEKLYGVSGHHGNSIVALPGGDFALLSGVEGAAEGLSLMRVDSAGTTLWEKTILTNYNVAATVVALADGFAISSAGSTLTRTDSDGSVLWQVKLGGMPWSLRVLSDGFALAGDAPSKTAGQLSGWLARTDAWGHASCVTSGLCATTLLAACDDSNPCTVDLCDPPAGCHSSALADGTACGTGTTCKAGVCQ